MSWSVNAHGTPEDVQIELAKQFAYPLAPGSAGLDSVVERETVGKIADTLAQILRNTDPEQRIIVVASGHITYSNWETRTIAGQTVELVMKLLVTPNV